MAKAKTSAPKKSTKKSTKVVETPPVVDTPVVEPPVVDTPVEKSDVQVSLEKEELTALGDDIKTLVNTLKISKLLFPSHKS